MVRRRREVGGVEEKRHAFFIRLHGSEEVDVPGEEVDSKQGRKVSVEGWRQPVEWRWRTC